MVDKYVGLTMIRFQINFSYFKHIIRFALVYLYPFEHVYNVFFAFGFQLEVSNEEYTKLKKNSGISVYVYL